MKFIYPAVFTPAKDGGYTAVFPDLTGCTACGGTLEDAIEKANEAAAEWLTVELAEDEPEIPPVSELADIVLAEGQVVRNILVNYRFYEGWDE